MTFLARAASAAALAIAAATAHAQTIEAAGGLTFYKEAIEPNAALVRERTGLTVKYAGPTTGLGIFLLVQGKAKVAFAFWSGVKAARNLVAASAIFAPDGGAWLATRATPATAETATTTSARRRSFMGGSGKSRSLAPRVTTS